MDAGNETKKIKQKRKSLNSIDAFILLALAALLLTPFVRLFTGRLAGLQYTDEAVVTFTVKGGSVEAVNAFKEGNLLLLTEDDDALGKKEGSELGDLQEFTVGNSRDGVLADASGKLHLRGAVTDSGFRTREGCYIIPFEKYTVTNGKASFTLTVTDVQSVPKS